MDWKEDLCTVLGIVLVLLGVVAGVWVVGHLHGQSTQRYIEAGFVPVPMCSAYREVWQKHGAVSE